MGAGPGQLDLSGLLCTQIRFHLGCRLKLDFTPLSETCKRHGAQALRAFDPLTRAEPVPAEIAAIHRWRRTVVRWWVATMVASVAVWAILGLFGAPTWLEVLSAAALLLLASLALWGMRRGACPRCGTRIRFQPRIELPQSCEHCGLAFFDARAKEL